MDREIVSLSQNPSPQVLHRLMFGLGMQDMAIGRSVCEHETRLPVNSAHIFFYFRVLGRILPRTYSLLTTVQRTDALWRKEGTDICGINYLVSRCTVL